MMEINTIVFSKDRPAQLDLLLGTIQKYIFGITSLTILYKTTNLCPNEYYIRLKQKYPNYEWLQETNFHQDFINLIDNFNDDSLILCFADDEIIYRPINLQKYVPYINDNIAFTLRVGDNINYCYVTRQNTKLPENTTYHNIDDKNSFYRWNWTNNTNPIPDVIFYPMSIVSNIFKLSLIKNQIKQSYFPQPNYLETTIYAMEPYFRTLDHLHPLQHIYCPKQSVSIILPYNQTQIVGANIFGQKYAFSLEEGIANYISGKTLKIDFTPDKVTQHMQEFPFFWE